jgi:hypothetical protein
MKLLIPNKHVPLPLQSWIMTLHDQLNHIITFAIFGDEFSGRHKCHDMTFALAYCKATMKMPLFSIINVGTAHN